MSSSRRVIQNNPYEASSSSPSGTWASGASEWTNNNSGKIGAAVGGAYGLGSLMEGNLNVGNAPDIYSNSIDRRHLNLDTGFHQENLSKIDGYEGSETSSVGGSALKGAAAGASIGSAFPGLGTLIGGAVGGIGGALSSIFGNKKARKRSNAARDSARDELGSYIDSYNSALGSVATENDAKDRSFALKNKYMGIPTSFSSLN